ncbi:MAG: DUF2470 domain-containing protein [Elusimicrobia bacterium]|nr:DUF2470 domain-containing protein [Elusimicrobiota bacterium]
MPENREHAYTTAPQDPNPAPEPSYAERARTLAHAQRLGILSTHSKKHAGYPFGSTMPYALDDAGRPVVLISRMAMHTQNLSGNPKASLFITPPEAAADPLGSARLTLVGTAAAVEGTELPGARALYLAAHENAKYYVDFKDFSFWRLAVEELYFVGGFGVMGWVTAADYAAARPDPLAADAAAILEHMNADHARALLDIARKEKGIEASEARMTAVDRLGFHVRLKTPERVQSVRIGFAKEARTPQECRERLVAMAKAARA